MKRPRTRVSDHAIVRYLERAQGLDIEALRVEIGRRVERGAELGATGVSIDGLHYVIAGGVVVTVERANTPDIRLGRKARK